MTLDRFTFKRNILIDRDLAANPQDPVRILDVGTMTSHLHHLDRANTTDVASKAVLLRDCLNIQLYYQYSNKQEGRVTRCGFSG